MELSCIYKDNGSSDNSNSSDNDKDNTSDNENNINSKVTEE